MEARLTPDARHGRDDALVAAILTAAAEMRALSSRLAGSPLDHDESVSVVCQGWSRVLTELRSGRFSSLAGRAEAQEDRISSREISTLVATALAPGEPGSVIAGKYLVERPLGRGGMGKVLLALHEATGRRVALKLLPALVDEPERSRRYFAHEARALGRLQHPNVASVFDADADGNLPYIAMEHVAGPSLADRLRESGALPADTVTALLRNILGALRYVHEAGVIHRDLKPQHIIVARDDVTGSRLKLIDFGLAILDQLDAEGHITAISLPAGTPAYMSPEQTSGEQLTPATDLYSLGVIAFELLTGAHPFPDAERPLQFFEAHQRIEPPPVASRLAKPAPRALTDAIDRALRKDRGERFATAAEFAAALQ